MGPLPSVSGSTRPPQEACTVLSADQQAPGEPDTVLTVQKQCDVRTAGSGQFLLSENWREPPSERLQK